MAYLHNSFPAIWQEKKKLLTHQIQWHAALLHYSRFTSAALFSTVLLVAESATGKSLLSLKATENRSLWASRSFLPQLHNYRYSGLSSSTRAWRGSLPLHCIPPSMVHWKPFGCLSLQALAPQVESRVSDEDSIGEVTKWHVMVVRLGIISSAKAEEERRILFITNAGGLFSHVHVILF